MIDIQGLFYINPKTKEYLVRIGNHLFPFKSSEEIVAYFLGKSKIAKKLKQTLIEPKTSILFSLFLTHRYLSNYLTNYEKSLNHRTQNIPKHFSEASLNLFRFFVLRCSF